MFTKTVTVPAPVHPCALPAWHIQAACDGNIDCLLGEFALTLEAEHEVATALKTCPGVAQ